MLPSKKRVQAMHRPEIDKPIKDQIDKLLDHSAEFYRAGNLEAALKIAHEAWDKIPDPKFKWDYYPQDLSVGFVEDYVTLGNVEKAKVWIENTYQAYDDHKRKSIYVLFIEGRALYNLDIKDEAYHVFDKIYQLSGDEWFKEEDRKYLKFYLDKKNAELSEY